MTEPDYFWFKKLDRISRYQTQKHKLEKDPKFKKFYEEGLSETQICTSAGYSKIRGIWHYKFVWLRGAQTCV